MDNEDSDSIGNNSVASSTGISSSNVAVSSTEDGENSLTSFEGILLNGIPHSMDIDAQNEDSNSSSSVVRNTNAKIKPLMLADLLEKKVEKEPPPTLNGVLCKELRIGDKGLELVDNHINKVINSGAENVKGVSVIVESTEQQQQRTPQLNNININININNNSNSSCSSVNNTSEELKSSGVKRPAEHDISNIDNKKRATNNTDCTNTNTNTNNIVSNNLNGVVDSPKPESIDSNEDSNANVSVSATAANIYASLAADILEDEEEELLMQQEQSQSQPQPHTQPQPQQMQVVQGSPMQQLIVTPTGQGDQQQLIVTPRQIIVSQGQIQSAGQQLVVTAGGQLALQQTTSTQSLKPMLVHHQAAASNAQRGGVSAGQMVLSPAATAGQIHYVQHGNQMQQVQLVQAGGAGAGQAGQLVIQAPAGVGVGPNAQYVIAAQSQTALVQGQPQTVLVAQTAQQQGTNTKTIIILQPQPQQTNVATAHAHHQKVMVTPQGQQVVVTQVQRPILQSPTVTNNNSNIPQVQVQVTSSPAATVITQNPPPSNQILIAPKERQQSSRPQTPIALDATTTTTTTIASSTSVITINTNTTSKTTASTLTCAQVLPPPPVIKDINHPWVCEWRGCTSTKKFKSANEVYMHACEIHCPMSANTNDELQCLWDRCDTMRRKRFSLMTHLHDRHCSPEIMKAVAVRRKQLSQQGKVELPAPTPPPPHPGYAPDAALHAIKRHALEFVNPKELQDDNEGPVTKSIRLTASLILRNLVIYSNNSRRYLRHYEPHLAGVALSNVESSRTIAQLLYDLNDTSTTRR